MVNQFSEISGDKNSLHMNPEIARKFRYRKPVVHGVLPFSFISLLQHDFPNKKICFTEISIKFKAPIFIGYEIYLSVQYHENEGEYHFNAEWYDNKTDAELIKSTGSFCLITQSKNVNHINSQGQERKCFVLDNLVENLLTRDDIYKQSESFQFVIDSGLSLKYREILQHAQLGGVEVLCDINTNLIGTLLISTLVGMRLPGRYATLLSLKISYKKTLDYINNYVMEGSVEKVATSSGKIKSLISITSNNEEYAVGSADVLINPPPRKLINCKEILDDYLDMGIKGKVVLITGASRGIGASAAKLFAMHGAKVVVNYLSGKTDADFVVKDIKASGGEAIAVQCDIRDRIQVKQMLSKTVDYFGSVDVLVNNAVKDFHPKSVLLLTWEDYLDELEVSLKGMHNCCQEVIEIFKKKKQGKIIGLSSIIVDNPITGQNKYITAKSAVVGYIRSLAKDLVEYNIQANLVVPNTTETDLLSSMPRNFIKKIGEEREFGRNLYPIEVAQSIVFLASKWADTITGQKVVLNIGEAPFL